MIANLLSILAGGMAGKAVQNALGMSEDSLASLLDPRASSIDRTGLFSKTADDYVRSSFQTLAQQRGRPADLGRVIESVGKKYDNTQVAATKMAMLEMLDDKRYSNLYGNSSDADTLRELRTALSGNLTETETRTHMSTFNRLFGGITEAGDTLKKRTSAYGQIIRSGNMKIDSANPMAAFDTFGNTKPDMPSYVKDIVGMDAKDPRRLRMSQFEKGLERAGFVTGDYTSQGAYSITTKIGGKSKTLHYAQYRIGTESIAVPLDSLKNYHIDDVGSVYFRDKAGSSMFSAPGKVLRYMKGQKEPVLQTGLQYLFGGKDAAIFDILKQSKESGLSLDKLLFTMDGSKEGEVAKMLEYTDMSDNPVLSLARKAAQVQVMDPERVAGSDPAAVFQEYLNAGRQHGIEMIPSSSPGQVGSDKFMYTSTSGKRADAPLFMRMQNATFEGADELTMMPDIEKRFIRPFTEPMAHMNPGSQRALAGNAMEDMYVFSKGAFGDMQKGGVMPFVNGTWYTMGKGVENYSNVVPLKDLADSSGLTLDIRHSGLFQPDVAERLDHGRLSSLFDELGESGEAITETEKGTFRGKNSIIEIMKGETKDGVFEPFIYNEKLQGFFDEVGKIQDLDPEARQKVLADILAKRGSPFEEGEFLGMNKVLGNTERQTLSVPGRGQIALRDVIQTSEGYKLAFGRVTDVSEGAKIEGSTKSVLSRNMLHGKSSALRQRYDQAIQSIVTDANFDFTQLDPKMTKATWEKLSDKAKMDHFASARQSSKLTVGGLAGFKAVDKRGMVQALEDVGKDMLQDKASILKSIGVQGVSSRDIGLVAEGKGLLGGNIKELRNQQMTALGKLTGERFKDISAHDLAGVNVGEFESAMQDALGAKSTPGDTQALAKYLRVAQQKMLKGGSDRQTALGAIFGAEQGTEGKPGALLKVLKGNKQALSALGLTDDFLDDLEGGIKNSTGVYGVSWHNVRDISDVKQANEAKIERRMFDHLYHGIQGEGGMAGPARHQFDTIMSRMQGADPANVEAMQRLISAQKVGPKETDLVLDLAKIKDPTEAAARLDKIRKGGGYLDIQGTKTYIPGEDLLARVTGVDTRAGRRIEDTRIKDVAEQMLTTVESGLRRGEMDMSTISELRKAYSGNIFEVANEVFNSRVEGSLRGTTYGQIRQSVDKVQREAKHGYTVGVGKRDIDAHFEELMRGAKKEEKAYLKAWKKDILSGKGSYGVYGFQNPQIGPESMSIFEAYYDKTLDKKGGYVIGAASEETGGAQGMSKRLAGFLTGKTSSDYDGDKAFFMMIGSSSRQKSMTKEALDEHYAKIRNLVGEDQMKVQFERQKAYYQTTYEFEKTIESSLEDIGNRGALSDIGLAAPRRGTAKFQELLTRAFQKGYGQSEVGLMSNRVLDLHTINYAMRDAGAISKEESMHMTAFFQAMEQKAVGFKHSSGLSAAAYVDQYVGRVLDTGSSVTDSLDTLRKLLGNLGYTPKAGTEILETVDKEQTARALFGLSLVKENYSAIEASRKAEKVGARTVMAASGREFNNVLSALHESDPGLSNMLNDAAFSALQAEDPEAAGRMMKEYQERIAAMNAETKQAGRAGPKATAAGRAASDALDIAEQHAKGILQNKFARVGLIAGAAMFGAYAIFNKGYDDTPLTDVPPPPPGRANMFARNADLQGIKSGAFLNDNYSKQDKESIQIANADYAESNIPSPTSIAQRSYINSATARISNRSLIMDRTNPAEYARAIQGAIPGSQVGVSINHNYNIPSDMERAL